MIDPDKRKAIVLLHQEGMTARELSRRLSISRNTVREILQHSGAVPHTVRKDNIEIDPELLRRLYADCEGFVQRIHEKLAAAGTEVGYSTLTRKVRELGLGGSAKRCDRVPDAPGAEMQHDTSPYRLSIGGGRRKVVASLVYFRFCKMRYLRFYRAFNRFVMKCFFHKALTHFRYVAPDCIIDNTSLARLHGTGADAVMAPEMEAFARRYGFRFVCHEVGHHDRKAGAERSFYCVETNFFPGRTFESLEDLNAQALAWATTIMANRPVGKAKLMPTQAFEQEKAYLIPLPPYVEPPLLEHFRAIDQYGYVAFDGNYFWVPGTDRQEVKVREYGDRLRICRHRETLVEYPRPLDGINNQLFLPEGMTRPPREPKNRRKPTAQEESVLRGISQDVSAYLDFAVEPAGIQKHRFIRDLFRLYRKLALSVFLETIKRALKYRIADIKTVERIALLYLSAGHHETPHVEIDEEFQTRPSYLEGRLADAVDMSLYDRLMDDEDG